MAFTARAPCVAPARCGCATRGVAVRAVALPRAAAPRRSALLLTRCSADAAGAAAAPAPKKGFGGKAAAAAAPPPLPASAGCPCGSGAAYEACCGPYHAGAALEPTAEAVLRARFSAYVKGGDAACAYIVASTHPRSADLARGGFEAASEAAKVQLARDTAATCSTLRFRKLTVLKADRGATEAEAWVTFRATYVERDADAPVFKQKRWREAEANKTLAEKSRFLQDAATGRWLYFGGTLLSPSDLGQYGTAPPPPPKA